MLGRSVAVLVALACLTSVSFGESYHVMELNVPSAGMFDFFDLNNLGQAAGQVSVDGQYIAAIVSPAGIQTLVPPAGGRAVAVGINDSETVALLGIAGDVTYSTLYQKGTYTPLPTRDGYFFLPQGISNTGRVGGMYLRPTEAGGYIQNGTFVPLPLARSAVTTVNARGDLLAQGVLSEGENSQAFVQTAEGALVPLPSELNGRAASYTALGYSGIAGGATLPLVGQQPGVPPAPPDLQNSSQAFIVVNGQQIAIPVQYFDMGIDGISKEGVVYGHGSTIEGDAVLWVFRDGALGTFSSALDAPVHLTRVAAINELNDLLAFGTDAAGNADYFLLLSDEGIAAPEIPEPATVALLPLGVLGLCIRRRRWLA
jgi:hypothetical protein